MVTTSKIPVAPGLLKERQLTSQQKIQALIKWYDIPKELVLNFNQAPLSYITVGNNTLEFEGAKSVPVKGKGKGKQIMGTFTVSATGRFLLMQLIYTGKTNRCHPQGIKFPSGFDVTHSHNHWSNEELAIQHTCEIVIPYVDKMDNGKGVYEVDVDTRLSRMKPIHARWVISLYDKLRNSEKSNRKWV